MTTEQAADLLKLLASLDHTLLGMLGVAAFAAGAIAMRGGK